MIQSTDKQKQEAQELLRACEKRTGIFLGSGSEFNDFAHHVALALASRDQEIREVLEGLAVRRNIDHKSLCWCGERWDTAKPHTPACLATQRLWKKLNP